MTTVKQSPIVLGKKYKDKRHGTEGFATVIIFMENGCVDVALEFNKAKDGDKPEIVREYVNELLLELNEEGTTGTTSYETDIVLGRKYIDIQSGLEGHACQIEFHELMTSRVTLRSVGYDKDGSKKLIYHSIDAFLLKDAETGVVAEAKDDKRSPITREVVLR